MNKAQVIRNLKLISTYHQIKDYFRINEFEFMPLKSAHFCELFYQNGIPRPVSDIDLIVSDLNQCQRLLEKFLSDIKVIESKQYKILFELGGSDSLPITLEVYQTIQIISGTLSVGDFKILEKEFVYLIFHASIQHNFLKKFWNDEIRLFYIYYKDQIKLSDADKYAREYRMLKAFRIVMAINKIEVERYQLTVFEKWLFDENYLNSGKQAGLKKYIGKHYLYDNFLDILKYDLKWAKSYLDAYMTKQKNLIKSFRNL